MWYRGVFGFLHLQSIKNQKGGQYIPMLILAVASLWAHITESLGIARTPQSRMILAGSAPEIPLRGLA
jgi:hypothetical protein